MIFFRIAISGLSKTILQLTKQLDQIMCGFFNNGPNSFEYYTIIDVNNKVINWSRTL